MKALFSILCVIVVVANCTKKEAVGPITDPCATYQVAGVGSVTGPDTVAVNQEVQFGIVFGVYNGCGGLGNFKTKTNGNTITVTVEAKYNNCTICTQAGKAVTANYAFKVSQTGIYYLNFSKGDGTLLTKNVVVR